jgi:hypothetical protein
VTLFLYKTYSTPYELKKAMDQRQAVERQANGSSKFTTVKEGKIENSTKGFISKNYMDFMQNYGYLLWGLH